MPENLRTAHIPLILAIPSVQLDQPHEVIGDDPILVVQMAVGDFDPAERGNHA